MMKEMREIRGIEGIIVREEMMGEITEITETKVINETKKMSEIGMNNVIEVKECQKEDMTMMMIE
jgi:hypothetical protein